VAGDFGAVAESPFSHPRVVAAVAEAGGVTGLGSRSDALGALFGDLLPSDVLERRTKATFEAVWTGERTREFAGRWEGEGVDPELVDVARLQELWRGPRSDARSALLLHRAWLETAGQVVDRCSTPKS
jgi:asparagine synthase (glutamine-hydrolysing)